MFSQVFAGMSLVPRPLSLTHLATLLVSIHPWICATATTSASHILCDDEQRGRHQATAFFAETLARPCPSSLLPLSAHENGAFSMPIPMKQGRGQYFRAVAPSLNGLQGCLLLRPRADANDGVANASSLGAVGRATVNGVPFGRCVGSQGRSLPRLAWIDHGRGKGDISFAAGRDTLHAYSNSHHGDDLALSSGNCDAQLRHILSLSGGKRASIRGQTTGGAVFDGEGYYHVIHVGSRPVVTLVGHAAAASALAPSSAPAQVLAPCTPPSAPLPSQDGQRSGCNILRAPDHAGAIALGGYSTQCQSPPELPFPNLFIQFSLLGLST